MLRLWWSLQPKQHLRYSHGAGNRCAGKKMSVAYLVHRQVLSANRCQPIAERCEQSPFVISQRDFFVPNPNNETTHVCCTTAHMSDFHHVTHWETHREFIFCDPQCMRCR